MPTPLQAAAPSLLCEEAWRPGRSADHYRQVLRRLLAGQRPAAISDYRCFSDGQIPADSLTAVEGYGQVVRHGLSSQVLFDALKARFALILSRDQQEGMKRRSLLAWSGGYASEAALLAYARTGERRFLQLFVDYFDAVIERRDDRLQRFDDYHRRVMKAWGSSRIDSNRWIALITQNAHILWPASRFALLVHQRPELAPWRATAERYQRVCQETLAEFEDDWQQHPQAPAGTLWYLRPPEREAEATNRVHLVGRVWLNLARLQGGSQYRERIHALIRIFRQGVVQESDGSVHWNYFPFFATGEMRRYPNGQDRSEPVWKGALTVPFLWEASAAGYPVPAELLQAIAQSFEQVLNEEGEIQRNLSPLSSRLMDADRDSEKIGMLQAVFGVVDFAKLRPAILTRLTELVARRPDLFPGAWLGSDAGLIGYAALLSPAQPPR
ncbi:MAG: hypothetical protein RLZZ32_1383 [Cyanobacteriota bacterium]